MLDGLWRHADGALSLSRLQPPPQRMPRCKIIGTRPPEFAMPMEAKKFSWMSTNLCHHPYLAAQIAASPDIACGGDYEVIYMPPQIRRATYFF